MAPTEVTLRLGRLMEEEVEDLQSARRVEQAIRSAVPEDDPDFLGLMDSLNRMLIEVTKGEQSLVG